MVPAGAVVPVPEPRSEAVRSGRQGLKLSEERIADRGWAVARTAGEQEGAASLSPRASSQAMLSTSSLPELEPRARRCPDSRVRARPDPMAPAPTSRQTMEEVAVGETLGESGTSASRRRRSEVDLEGRRAPGRGRWARPGTEDLQRDRRRQMLLQPSPPAAKLRKPHRWRADLRVAERREGRRS